MGSTAETNSVNSSPLFRKLAAMYGQPCVNICWYACNLWGHWGLFQNSTCVIRSMHTKSYGRDKSCKPRNMGYKSSKKSAISEWNKRKEIASLLGDHLFEGWPCQGLYKWVVLFSKLHVSRITVVELSYAVNITLLWDLCKIYLTKVNQQVKHATCTIVWRDLWP